MRSLVWFVALSLGVLAAAVAASGCGGSAGAGRDAASDVSNATSGSGGRGGGAGSGGVGGAAGDGTDAAACTPMGESVATFDAGAVWACFQTACMSSLVTCAADCPCNNAMLNALICVSTTGDRTGCFTMAAVSGGTNAVAVALCLNQSSAPGAACGPAVSDAGAGGAGGGAGGSGGAPGGR